MFVLFITPFSLGEPAGRVEETAPEAESIQQDSASRLLGERSPRPHATGSCGAWTCRRHSGILWGPEHRRGIAQKLCGGWNGTLPPTPRFPGQRTLGTRSAHPGLAPFAPTPGHSLGFPATSAWSQGPPCAQGNVSGFPRRLRLRLQVQLLTLCRVSVSVLGGLLWQPTHRHRLPGKF